MGDYWKKPGTQDWVSIVEYEPGYVLVDRGVFEDLLTDAGYKPEED